MDYEIRIVAFVDILGFKSIVDSTTRTGDDGWSVDSVTSCIRDAISELRDSANSFDFRFTHFSDSFVVSTTYRDRTTLFAFFLSVIGMVQSFLFGGILLRGGVAKGSLYHNHDLLFGPALISAYDLESSKAFYPRIIVDDDIIATLPSGDVAASWLSRDQDGFYFVDYISKWGKPFYLEPEYLLSIRRILLEMQKCDQNSIAKKFEWLRIKFNERLLNFDPIETKKRVNERIEDGDWPARLLKEDYDRIMKAIDELLPI